MARHKGSPHRNSDTITVIGGSPVRMCAVYAIGTNDGPTRIWYALKTGGLIEPGSDQKIVAIGWAPELKPARRVAKRCHRLLIQAGRNIGNASDDPRQFKADDLFEINADWAKKVIGIAAREEGVPLYSNAELQKLKITKSDWRDDMLDRRADMFPIRHDPVQPTTK